MRCDATACAGTPSRWHDGAVVVCVCLRQLAGGTGTGAGGGRAGSAAHEFPDEGFPSGLARRYTAGSVRLSRDRGARRVWEWRCLSCVGDSGSCPAAGCAPEHLSEPAFRQRIAGLHAEPIRGHRHGIDGASFRDFHPWTGHRPCRQWQNLRAVAGSRRLARARGHSAA